MLEFPKSTWESVKAAWANCAVVEMLPGSLLLVFVVGLRGCLSKLISLQRPAKSRHPDCSVVNTQTDKSRQTDMQTLTYMPMFTHCKYKGRKKLWTDFSSAGKSLMEAWLMVTPTEPAKIRCCATVLEPEIQWDWMPEDIYSNKMNCWSSVLPPPVPICSAVLLQEKEKKRRKNLFLPGSHYLQYLAGCIFNSNAN